MKHILVIGAAGGLGSAVVANLLGRGDVVHASTLDDVEELALREHAPGVASVVRLDLSQADQLSTRLRSYLPTLGRLDAVIVCAAISPYGPMETASLDLLRRTMEINYISNVAIFQSVLPVLRQTEGRLILTSSMSGVLVLPLLGAYSASKFALEGAVDAMRREAEPQGVKVVLIEPGGIKTPMLMEQLRELPLAYDALQPDLAERYGYLYRGYEGMVRKSHREQASSPEKIAEILIGALDAEQPEPRYPAGADAEQLISFVKKSGWREVDQMLNDAMLGSTQ